ncbi:MAG: hypothetical protein M3490_10250 [Chloroflexota bacterium]|nr:hypothetical protein [Chloroflexota bacterium]
MIDALEPAARLEVAVWGVVAEAFDDVAVRFYESFGFLRIETYFKVVRIETS